MPALLALFTRRPEPAPLLQVARFRGLARGWEPIGSPRPEPAARRLAAIAARINPAATLRVSPATPAP